MIRASSCRASRQFAPSVRANNNGERSSAGGWQLGTATVKRQRLEATDGAAADAAPCFAPVRVVLRAGSRYLFVRTTTGNGRRMIEDILRLAPPSRAEAAGHRFRYD